MDRQKYETPVTSQRGFVVLLRFRNQIPVFRLLLFNNQAGSAGDFAFAYHHLINATAQF